MHQELGSLIDELVTTVIGAVIGASRNGHLSVSEAAGIVPERDSSVGER